MMKDEVFQMRLTEDDRRRIDLLAQRYGISGAGVIRMFLRQAVSDAELAALPQEPDGAQRHTQVMALAGV